MWKQKTILIPFLLFGSLINAQQLTVQENAAIFIQSNASMQFGGGLDNYGLIENSGQVDLFGDFNNYNIFNGSEGVLNFFGGDDQMITNNSYFELRRLSMNSSGISTFQTDSIVVTGEIGLYNGILKLRDDASLVLLDGVSVLGGNEDSFVDGPVTHFGSGPKYFPIGDSLFFDPIEFEYVYGLGTQIKAHVVHPHPEPPIPGASLFGVSEHALWTLELLSGFFDSTQVIIDFAGADLENFTIRNDQPFIIESPVVAFRDSIGGEFESLGVSELNNTDSLTSGVIKSARPISFATNNEINVAIAKGPLIPEEGVVHIPNAFSPRATDPLNRSFRVFGENISDQNFSMRVFNRVNLIVYQTNDFQEANTRGWDGTIDGVEEPAGLYYYSIQLERNDIIERFEGPLYLIR